MKQESKQGYDSANIFCKLTLWWVFPFLKKYFGKTFGVNSCYKCPESDRCQVVGNRLANNWETELRKHKYSEKASLLRACCRTFGPNYLLICVAAFVWLCVIRMGTSLSLSLIVTYLNKWNTDQKNETKSSDFRWNSNLGYIYYSSAGFCILIALEVAMNPLYLFANKIGMQLRVSLTYLIYNKALTVSSDALRYTTVGQIVNLLSSDVNKIDITLFWAFYLVIGPLQMVLIIGLLWYQIGYSCLSVVVLMALYFLFQAVMSSLFSKFRKKSIVLTDNRLRIMSEIIPAMRVIKMYVWEKPFRDLISNSRSKEISSIQKSMILRSINLAIYFISSKLITFLCLIVFLIIGGELTPEKVFVSITLINQLRENMTQSFPTALSLLAESRISMKRIENFLLLEDFEFLPELNESSNSNSANVNTNDNKSKENLGEESDNQNRINISVQNVSAQIKSNDGILKNVLENISFDVMPGKLMVIIGSVGSGKTAILMAILKELKIYSGFICVKGKVGYASQESWIFAGTVRDNILFGKEFDEKKYKEVIHVTALEEDMKQLSNGDQTMVGDRGITLSGGQRARVSLARTLYSNADCYLLDDPLSAVDSSVAKHIFEKCIKGYLKRKCVILVTHQLQYIQSAHQIIILKDGKCLTKGNYSQLLKECIDLIKYAGNEDISDNRRRKSSITEMTGTRLSMDGSISYAEEMYEDVKHIEVNEDYEEFKDSNIKEGPLANIYWIYLRSGGGYILLPLLLLSHIVTQILFTGSDFWLSKWTNYYQNKNSTKNWMISENQNTNIIIYSLIIVIIFLLSIIRTIAFFVMCMRASVYLHNKLINAVIRAPIAFFDKYPIGMIMNRVSRDLGIIDDLLPTTIFDVILILSNCLSIWVLCVFINYWILIPTLVLLIGFIFVWMFTVGTLRRLQKLEGIARTPLFSHFNSTLNGLITIRSFGAQKKFTNKLNALQDRHTNVFFTLISVSRWFAIVLDELCLVFIIVVTISLIINISNSEINSSVVALTLSQVIFLCNNFQWGIRMSADVETQMISVERVAELHNIESECDNEVKPPEEWPKWGRIVLKDVSLRYERNDSPVLNHLNLEIKSGKKIGIVGRTGAGKSSLIAILFRMTPPSGLIEIDGVDTSTIGLSHLRRKISIIPQEPILFTETVRKNLDPFGEFKDDFIWEVLDRIRLKDTINSFPQKLDQTVSESGSTFSVGQKQLICLARALLRNNKILIMDEVTANVDPKTDALIQETIRNEFTDCTVLTIAHRLDTIIDYDRVLVLESGHIKQLDAPHNLIQESNGIFASMVSKTGKSMEKHLKEIAFQSYSENTYL